MLARPAWCRIDGRRSGSIRPKALRHHLVEHLGAEAAADHQHAQRPAALAVALLRRFDGSDAGSDRIAAPTRLRQRAWERHHDPVGNPREHLVGKPGDRILLVQHQRPAEQDRHHAAGEGDVAAESEDYRRIRLAHRPQRLPECTQQVQRQQQLGQQALCRAVRRSSPASSRCRAAAPASPPCPSGLPSQTTRHSRSRSSSATARPGKICPPVPPAMIMMVRGWDDEPGAVTRAFKARSPASGGGSRNRCAIRWRAPGRSSGSRCRRSSSAAGSAPWSAAAPG